MFYKFAKRFLQFIQQLAKWPQFFPAVAVGIFPGSLTRIGREDGEGGTCLLQSRIPGSWLRSWIMDPGIWILDTGLKFSIQDLRKWEGGAAALLSWSSAKLPHLWIKLLISGGFWTFVKALVRKGVLPAESFCLEHCLCNERWALMLPQSWTGEEERWEWFYLSNQGGRSCTGARAVPAEKFGLGRKFQAWTYAILSRIKICRDLRTFWRSLGKKSAFLGHKQTT